MRRGLTYRVLFAAAVAACSGGDSPTGPPPVPEPAALSLATQPPTSGQNGVALAPQPVVRLRTSTGAVAPKAGVVVTAALVSGSVTLSGATATTNADGVATFSALTLTGLVGSYTLRFTAPNLTAVDAAAPTVLAAGPPTGIAVATQPPASAQSGSAMSPAPAVQLRDQSGNAATQAGVAVTASLVSGSLVLSNASVTTDASGLATFTGLTLSGTVGSYALRFTAQGFPPVDAAAATSLTPGPATQIAITTQPAATATNGAALATQPVVQLRDAWGNNVPQAAVVVTATVLSGTVTLTNATATTNASGAATFSGLALGGAVGSYTLRFAASGLPAVLAAAATQLQPGVATQLGITTAPALVAQSGVALSPQPVVQVRDSSGNAAALGGVVVTASVVSGTVTLTNATATTDSTGAARFSGLTLAGAVGAYQLRFSAPNLTPVDAFQATNLQPGPAALLVITTQPSTAAQNAAALARQPIVRLQDAQGNNVSLGNITVTASLVSGTAALGSATALTSAQGVATFSGLAIIGTVGSYTFRFSAPSIASVDASAPTVLSAGPARQLTLTTQPATSAQSGVVLAPQPVVQVRDTSGNAVSLGGQVVTASVVSGTAALSGASATTNASGVATFTTLAITALAGPYTLRFSSGTLTPADAAQPTQVSSGAVAGLTLIIPPSSAAQSGIALATQPVVELLDAASNPVSGTTVTASIQRGSATLRNATAVTTAGGSATFVGLTVDGTVGSYTIQFAAGGHVVAALTPTVLAAGLPASLVVTTQPAPAAQSGVALATQPAATVLDAAGNPVAGVVVTASTVSGSPTLTNASATTDADGVASFSGLTLTGPAGPYTLRFAGASLAATAPTTLGAGVPASLTFQTTPSATASNGFALATQPVVLVQDGAGNPVSGVTVTAAATTGGVTVANGAATTNGSGLATFSGLTLLGTAAGNTLRFSTASLTLDAAITLSAGTAAQIVITTPPPSSAQNGVAFVTVPAVVVKDASNNSVSGVTVLATAAGATVVSGTAVSDGTGTATFTGLTLDGLVGNYTLVFSVGPVSATAGVVTALAAGPAARLILTTQPSVSARSGIALATQPVVQLTDAGGNLSSASGVVVTASLVSGNLTLSNVTATSASGIATFANLTLAGATGSYTLRFSAPSLSGVDASGPTVMTAGPATQLTLTVQPSNSAILGSALAQQPVVQVRDAQGNALDTSGVAIAASAVSGSPTLMGTTANTGSGGVATFGALGVTSPQGNYRFRFTATGLSAVNAADTTVVAPPLQSGTPVTGLASGTVDQQKPFAITVPPGATQLKVEITGPTGGFDDADLIVRHGAVPDLVHQRWDCYPGLAGNNETCVFPNPQAGDWYVTILTYSAFINVTLTATATP